MFSETYFFMLLTNSTEEENKLQVREVVLSLNKSHAPTPI